jgi:pimeloyl-ACP methyl ester carboxylesterase/DNA-binding CsgD family transcriptional regulator
MDNHNGQHVRDILTEREKEILARLSTGLSDQQIADELFLSLNTVKWYNRQIYSKLGVDNRTQAIASAKNLESSIVEQRIRFCRSSDGVRIAYATSGTGPPLVHAANWLTHLDLDWQSPIRSHWFEALSQEHTLVRYDMRGSGLSDRIVDDLSLDAWVRDLETVVDDLKLDQFPLLGLCHGGAVAIAYAARHPDRVSHLILYDSYVQGVLTQPAHALSRRQAEALTEMIKVGWGRKEAAFRKVFVDLLMPEASKEEQDWLSELQRQTVSPETAARLWIEFNRIDISNLVSQVQVPTLVFHIRGDGIVPFEDGRRLASLIPDARFVPLDGNNHILLEHEPAWQKFVAALRSFLAE